MSRNDTSDRNDSERRDHEVPMKEDRSNGRDERNGKEILKRPPKEMR